MFNWLFGSWQNAVDGVEDFRTGRTHNSGGDVRATLALMDLRNRTGNKAVYYELDAPDMVELERLYREFDNLFAGCATYNAATVVIDALFFAAQPITEDEYLDLLDAARYYYRGELENSNRFSRYQERASW